MERRIALASLNGNWGHYTLAHEEGFLLERKRKFASPLTNVFKLVTAIADRGIKNEQPRPEKTPSSIILSSTLSSVHLFFFTWIFQQPFWQEKTIVFLLLNNTKTNPIYYNTKKRCCFVSKPRVTWICEESPPAKSAQRLYSTQLENEKKMTRHKDWPGPADQPATAVDKMQRKKHLFHFRPRKRTVRGGKTENRGERSRSILTAHPGTGRRPRTRHPTLVSCSRGPCRHWPGSRRSAAPAAHPKTARSVHAPNCGDFRGRIARSTPDTVMRNGMR